MSRSALPVTVRRLPNLVIIGVARGGTTSLFHYLGQHPDIGTSDVKEVRYFTPIRRGEPLAPLDSYAAHFSHCTERYAVEATPGYFSGGRPLARAMRETCPGVHALLSLRSPADRCWSWFQFVKSRTRIPRDMTFDTYLDRCEQLHVDGVDETVENQPFWGLGGGCYAQWLDGWIDEFGDDLRIVFFDDVATDPRQAVAGICDWLGVDSDVVAALEFAVDNKAEQYRHRRLQQLAVAANRRGERFFHRHQAAKRMLRGAYYVVNKAPSEPAMSASARRRLDDFYRPHNARLAEQLARVGLELPSDWPR